MASSKERIKSVADSLGYKKSKAVIKENRNVRVKKELLLCKRKITNFYYAKEKNELETLLELTLPTKRKSIPE